MARLGAGARQNSGRLQSRRWKHVLVTAGYSKSGTDISPFGALRGLLGQVLK